VTIPGSPALYMSGGVRGSPTAGAGRLELYTLPPALAGRPPTMSDPRPTMDVMGYRARSDPFADFEIVIAAASVTARAVAANS
jgi:hypothetical protein